MNRVTNVLSLEIYSLMTLITFGPKIYRVSRLFLFITFYLNYCVGCVMKTLKKYYKEQSDFPLKTNKI